MSDKPKKTRATIRDVAKLAEVAPITVSRVVNNSGYISAETRSRVQKAIEALNYIPNTLSQSLRYQKTDMITLLIADVTNPYWTYVARGVEDICNTHELNVILCNTDDKSEKLEAHVRLLLQRQIDGFIIAPTSNDTHIIQMARSNQIPVVLIDRVLPDVDVPAVYSDNETGARLLIEHLVELGHRRIAMLASTVYQSTSIQRVTGYRKTLENYGIPVDNDLIHYGSYSQQSGYDMTQQLLNTVDDLPTAIFAANNHIAVGAQKALAERNFRIPNDISLVTFDDLPLFSYPKPFLTTILQDSYRMGQEAASLLVKQIQGEGYQQQAADIVLPVQLVLRDSCALHDVRKV